MLSSDFKPNEVNVKQVKAINALTQTFEDLAMDIEDYVSPSAHRTAGLRKLLESKMTVIHAITHPSI